MILLTLEMAMSKHCGDTLLLSGFESSASVSALKRLHFSKKGNESAPYNEAWLQRLIMRHPSVLPAEQVEGIFTPLIPICIELPTQTGRKSWRSLSGGQRGLMVVGNWRHKVCMNLPERKTKPTKSPSTMPFHEI